MIYIENTGLRDCSRFLQIGSPIVFNIHERIDQQYNEHVYAFPWLHITMVTHYLNTLYIPSL